MNLTTPMPIHRLFLGCSALALALTLAPAAAVEVATVPEGYVKLTIPSSTQNTVNYLSLPMTAAPVFSGKVTSVSSNSFETTGATWTANEFANPDQPHFVRFTSGQQSGRALLISSNATSSVTVDIADTSSQSTPLTQSGFSVVVDDTLEIFPGDTLARLFGDGSVQNPLIFDGSTHAILADTVSVYNPATLRWEAFYFNTTRSRWEISNSTAFDRGNTVLYPQAAFLVTRRANKPAVDLVLTGRVPSVTPLTKTTGSNSVRYVSTQFPVDVQLGDLNFGSNWNRNNFAILADTLSVWNKNLLRWEAYYQLPDLTWRKNGDAATNQASFVIPAGTAVALLKRGTVTGPTSFISTPLPYDLNP